jgi:endonuclease/exonuclease/phosphatase family metal-dependent hydrolase
MKNTIILFILALSVISSAQEKIIFANYNVENLFDTIDDPHKNDNDFLPEGKKRWTEEKYKTKLENLAKVISALSPQLLALEEIENEKVLLDLVNQPSISGFNYQIIHEESPDFRGIDVALLYTRDSFKYLWHRKKPIMFPTGKRYSTRDILYVCGVTNSDDTLVVFINHWPSRLGGEKKSAPKRNFVARKLRESVKDIQAAHPEYAIIISGDFNDNPSNFSISGELEALENPQCLPPFGLYNTSASLSHQTGTLKYRGKWYMFDQIIVSANLVDGKGIDIVPNSFEVFSPQWLKEPSGKYKGYPLRSFAGKKYLGGYSDHFPVKIEIAVLFTDKKKQNKN